MESCSTALSFWPAPCESKMEIRELSKRATTSRDEQTNFKGDPARTADFVDEVQSH